jgi:hypothetical protein
MGDPHFTDHAILSYHRPAETGRSTTTAPYIRLSNASMQHLTVVAARRGTVQTTGLVPAVLLACGAQMWRIHSCVNGPLADDVERPAPTCATSCRVLYQHRNVRFLSGTECA